MVIKLSEDPIDTVRRIAQEEVVSLKVEDILKSLIKVKRTEVATFLGIADTLKSVNPPIAELVKDIAERNTVNRNRLEQALEEYRRVRR